MESNEKKHGAQGFDFDYWHENYASEFEMDGIINAREHARYAKAFFDIEFQKIDSIGDLGLGLGHLFFEFIKAFNPQSALGIEPSSHAFNLVAARKFVSQRKIELQKIDIVSFLNSYKGDTFDLGICTSVFQYLEDEVIDYSLKKMAEYFRYLYFSVPTDLEYIRQDEELNFVDRFATRRTKEFYYQKLSPHFSIISSRILESKIHFSQKTSSFTDLLFRFL